MQLKPKASSLQQGNNVSSPYIEKIPKKINFWEVIIKMIMALCLLCTFLIGVKLLETSFGLFGSGFSKGLFILASNPISGLFIGILTTSLVQSSSVTTSMTVGLVSSGTITIDKAIPIIMGANIGTSVTNSLVSLGNLGVKENFKRAFAAATIHDFFNILTVMIVLPLEVAFGILEKVSTWLASILYGSTVGSFSYDGPVKTMLKPIIGFIKSLVTPFFGDEGVIPGAILAIIASAFIILSLSGLVKVMSGLVKSQLGERFNRTFAHPVLSIAFGMIFTFLVQSSSVTTSLLVPLASAGLLNLEVILPLTMGANLGTTTTALLASLTGNISGLTIALVHFFFNLLGILLWYPIRALRKVPIYLATSLAEVSAQKKIWGVMYVIGMFFLIPLSLIWAS